jgi:5-formyltetrahydrofolate cyclo-ligase
MDIKKIKNYSLRLNKKIIALNEFKNAKSIFCYVSFDSEIDTYYLLQYCLENNKILCVPVIKDNKMIASRIRSLDNFKKNNFNIPEPSEICEIKKNEIDLIIVPALAYNPLGFRLGYGKGFYDNYLKDYNGYTIGMIFKKFVTTDLIPDKYDIPVNKLIIL